MQPSSHRTALSQASAHAHALRARTGGVTSWASSQDPLPAQGGAGSCAAGSACSGQQKQAQLAQEQCHRARGGPPGHGRSTGRQVRPRDAKTAGCSCRNSVTIAHVRRLCCSLASAADPARLAGSLAALTGTCSLAAPASIFQRVQGVRRQQPTQRSRARQHVEPTGSQCGHCSGGRAGSGKRVHACAACKEGSATCRAAQSSCRAGYTRAPVKLAARSLLDDTQYHGGLDPAYA